MIMAEDAANVVPLLVSSTSRGWKASERVSEDLAPQLSSLSIGNKSPICQVCEKHVSRYVCPRCQLPYCSVACFSNHSSSESPCTEDFYKDRVAAVMRLEALEQKDQQRKFLSDVYHKQLTQQDSLTSDTDRLEETHWEELHHLLEVLESNTDGSDDSRTREQCLALLSPSLREKFQRDLQNESVLSSVLPLKSWHPWWKRQLGAVRDETESTAVETHSPTLDERLMRVPLFSTLSKTPPPPQLLYHLIDILFSYAFTMRLYHGLPNILHNDLASEAAQSLLQQSQVLSMDRRFEHLEEVLGECSTRLVSQPAIQWTTITDDFASILTSKRYVGRALLESNDILKSAIKSKKQRQTNDKNDQPNDLAKMRRVRKKLEFFLAWSQQATELGEQIQSDILGWMEHWKAAGIDESQEPTIQELKLPSSDDSPNQRGVASAPGKSDSPWMVEVISRDKTKPF